MQLWFYLVCPTFFPSILTETLIGRFLKFVFVGLVDEPKIKLKHN